MDIIRDESVKRKKRRTRILIGAAGVVAVLVVTFIVSGLKPAAPPVEYSTIWPDTVKRGSMMRQVRGLGSLVPIPEDVRVIPAETDVRVDRILILPGTPVKPDSIIMELSNPQVAQEALAADLDLKSAEAEFHNTKAKVDSDLISLRAGAATVEADYENAKRDYEANIELNKIGVLSGSALKTSASKARELETRNKLEQERIAESTKAVETQLAVQQANIDQKRAMAGLKHRLLDALKVRAGITGVLQELPLQVGQRAAQGTILAKVVQPEHLKAELKIPETQAKDIVDQLPAEIDTHNGIVKGYVSRIDPASQNGTVTVDVTLTEPPPKGARPDLSVDGTITLEKLDNVLYVGRPAFGQEKSTVGMFKIDPDGKGATRVPVELGRSSVNTIEVVRGLKEGDQVILSDMTRYDNQERITLTH
ncbi:MAG TPA: HlyD family efflux transporter periplasmic adaptor subunit [Candidatus Angelobacter sp.]|jgi:multidrug efflux pump subunit AcrA (membrane-fusion protein)|nr:HlyD family efflux transporter periplasmic adaptor subunit [Candidatus Angelobacter sp.]